MTTLSRNRSAGRESGSATVGDAWLHPAMEELRSVQACIVRDHGAELEAEAGFAILWAGNWLLGYAAGWCSLIETLDAAKRVATKLPPEKARMLLGVVAHKALLVTPRRLGEQKPKTPPHLIQCIGPAVQAFLFDDDGLQQRTVGEAIECVVETISQRELLPVVPSTELVKQWFTEWRSGADDRGEHVPRPSRGRPRKMGV